MSSRYRFHAGTRLALLQNEGALSLEGWEAVARELVAGKPAGGTWRILGDRRRSAETYPAWHEDRVVGFIRQCAQQLGDVQWAVVVPEQTAALDAVRLAAQQTQGTRVRIRAFTDVAEALRWLLGVYDDD